MNESQFDPNFTPTRRRYTRCIDCGISIEEAGHISSRGLCANCGKARMHKNADEIKANSGDYAKRRAAGYLRMAQRLYREQFGTDPIA